MAPRLYISFFMAVISLLCLVLVGACQTDPVESEGTVTFSQEVAVLLPPGHPGQAKGSTLVIPAESDPPAIHYANCFAGVPNRGDFGIGSGAGYTKDYIGSMVLPVNVNLGSNVMDYYKVRIEIGDTAIEMLPSSVDGSYSRLSTNDCLDRCNPVCSDNPQYYPKQFDRAEGFEYPPKVTALSGGTIVVEAADADTSDPTTGTVNLCNVPVRIVGELPPSSGVTVSFTVESLQDPAGNEMTKTPLSGLIIENIQLK